MRRHGPPVLLGMVVAVAVVVGVGAVLLGIGAIESWDERTVADVAARRTALGDTLTEWGTWLAETVPVAALSLATAFVAWRRWRTWAAPLFVAVAVGGEKLIYLIASLIVGRDRPAVPTLGTTTATRSYPSGHVASAVSLYGAIALLVGLLVARHWRVVLWVVVVAIAAVVAVCRVYRGFHYPLDVIVGATLGACWLGFVWRRFGPELTEATVNPGAPARAMPRRSTASVTSRAAGSPR